MQQDYILRMIQQLSGFISGVMQLRKGGRAEIAIEQLQDAIGRFSGLSATLVHAISEDDLIQLLRARGGVDPDRAWALAELLREEALSYDELGKQAEATPRYLKSMRLYLEVLDVIEEMPDLLKVDGLEEVIEKVADLELIRSTRLRLVEYFVSTGRFDRAENVVLWSMDAESAGRTAVSDAFEFYDQLLRKPAIDLEEGNLPRAEVEDGLERMRVLLEEFDQVPMEE